MKTILAATFALFAATSANAGVFDDFKADLKDLVQTFPAHEENRFRDTGCDASAFIDIVNEEGVVLYRNNATCPDVGGAGFDVDAMSALYPAPVVKEDDDEGNGCDTDGNNGNGNDPDKDDPSNPGKGKGKGKH